MFSIDLKKFKKFTRNYKALKEDRMKDGLTNDLNSILRVGLFASSYLKEILGILFITTIMNFVMDFIILNKDSLLHMDSVWFFVGAGFTLIGFILSLTLLIFAYIITYKLTFAWDVTKVID